MSKWKSRKLKVAAALVFLVGPGIGIASAQTPTPAAHVIQVNDTTKDIKATPASFSDEDAWTKKYLDKNGGYKDSKGGYYDPKAGTYTDKDGGIVDNWSGYTYKDGSYKSKLGDYYDAPTKTYKLADGTVAKVDTLTADQAIKALRDNVEANDGYDKDLTRKSMIASIKIDHPQKTPNKPQNP
jgi:hypothetical protein